MMTLTKTSKITSAENVLTITFKVKDTTDVDSTTITFKDITVSGGIEAEGGTGDVNVGNAKVTLTKETTVEPIKTPTSSETSYDKTTAKTKKIPQTGVESVGDIAIVSLSVLFVAINLGLYLGITKKTK